MSPQKPGVGPAKGTRRVKGKQGLRQADSNQTASVNPGIIQIPKHAALCEPNSGKWRDINLLQQPSLVRKVVRKAIKDTTAHMFLECAWPDIISRPIFGKPVLLTAAKDLQIQYPQIKDIREQLRENEDYVQALSHLVSLLGCTNLCQKKLTFTLSSLTDWRCYGIQREMLALMQFRCTSSPLAMSARSE